MPVTTGDQHTLLDAYGGYAPGKTRIVLTGSNQLARRFIHAPRFEWSPVPDAVRYRVALWSGAAAVLDNTVTDPAVGLADVWPGLPDGRVRMCILALDATGALVGFSNAHSFHKVPGWTGDMAPARFPYAETATRIMRWLARDSGEGRYDQGAPPYFWHAEIYNTTDSVITTNPRAFPALHNPLGVQAFLAYARSGTDPALRAEAMHRARALADFTIAHSTPADHRYAFLPYHTIAQGRLGLHGGHRPDLHDIVEPNKAGHMGVAYLDLFDVTGDSSYREAAARIAATLAETQNDDGSWYYRVNSVTGATEEQYTSTGVFALLLLDRIRRLAPDARYQQAYDAILTWMLENPVRTYRWENIFDDTAYTGPYTNQGNYDALFMGRFLLDHASDDARFVGWAEDLFRWVDDNFVLYAEDPFMPYRAYTPTVTEQWRYYWPMDVHTANWLLFLIRLWQVTGSDGYRQRAIGAANVVTQCQMTDGRSTTYVPDADGGVRGHQGRDDWYGCMFLPITALLEAAATLT